MNEIIVTRMDPDFLLDEYQETEYELISDLVGKNDIADKLYKDLSWYDKN
jgi:hypothetical protein